MFRMRERPTSLGPSPLWPRAKTGVLDPMGQPLVPESRNQQPAEQNGGKVARRADHQKDTHGGRERTPSTTYSPALNAESRSAKARPVSFWGQSRINPIALGGGSC